MKNVENIIHICIHIFFENIIWEVKLIYSFNVKTVFRVQFKDINATIMRPLKYKRLHIHLTLKQACNINTH